MRKKVLTLCLLCITVCVNAQYEYFTEEEKAVFINHETEIDSRIELIKQDKYMEYLSQYKVLEEYRSELYHLIGLQEKRKICYDYIYPDEAAKRWTGKVKVEADYKNPVFGLLFLSGNDISSPNLHIVAASKKDLKLTSEQENNLVVEAIKNRSRLDKKPRRDLWKEELTALQEILTEEQMEGFFIHKNSEKTMRLAKSHWERLKENEMSHDLDSATAVKQIYLHQMKKQKAADIYAYDDNQKREAWTAIDQSAPLPVRRIYSLTRKNQAKKQGYRGSFTW